MAAQLKTPRSPARDRPGPAAPTPQAHCSRRPRLGSARWRGPHDDDRHCRWRHADRADPAAHGCEPAAPISQRQASATREPDDRIRISGPYAGDEYFGDDGIAKAGEESMAARHRLCSSDSGDARSATSREATATRLRPALLVAWTGAVEFLPPAARAAWPGVPTGEGARSGRDRSSAQSPLRGFRRVSGWVA